MSKTIVHVSIVFPLYYRSSPKCNYAVLEVHMCMCGCVCVCVCVCVCLYVSLCMLMCLVYSSMYHYKHCTLEQYIDILYILYLSKLSIDMFYIHVQCIYPYTTCATQFYVHMHAYTHARVYTHACTHTITIHCVPLQRAFYNAQLAFLLLEFAPS